MTLTTVNRAVLSLGLLAACISPAFAQSQSQTIDLAVQMSATSSISHVNGTFEGALVIEGYQNDPETALSQYKSIVIKFREGDRYLSKIELK